MKGLSLNFAALRSVLEGETGDGVTQRVERWALRRLSGVLQIETLWRFNAKYEPRWLPRYIVFDSAEQFVPVVVQIMRAESLTEVPVIGRLLMTSGAKRAGPPSPTRCSPHSQRATVTPAGRRPRPRDRGRERAHLPPVRAPRCAPAPRDGGPCEDCDRCWADEQRRERPPHHVGPVG